MFQQGLYNKEERKIRSTKKEAFNPVQNLAIIKSCLKLERNIIQDSGQLIQDKKQKRVILDENTKFNSITQNERHNVLAQNLDLFINKQAQQKLVQNTKDNNINLSSKRSLTKSYILSQRNQEGESSPSITTDIIQVKAHKVHFPKGIKRTR